MTYILETRYSGVFDKYVIDSWVYDEHCVDVIRTEVLLTTEQAKRIVAGLSELIAEREPKPELAITEDMVEFY